MGETILRVTRNEESAMDEKASLETTPKEHQRPAEMLDPVLRNGQVSVGPAPLPELRAIVKVPRQPTSTIVIPPQLMAPALAQGLLQKAPVAKSQTTSVVASGLSNTSRVVTCAPRLMSAILQTNHHRPAILPALTTQSQIIQAPKAIPAVTKEMKSPVIIPRDEAMSLIIQRDPVSSVVTTEESGSVILKNSQPASVIIQGDQVPSVVSLRDQAPSVIVQGDATPLVTQRIKAACPVVQRNLTSMLLPENIRGFYGVPQSQNPSLLVGQKHQTTVMVAQCQQVTPTSPTMPMTQPMSHQQFPLESQYQTNLQNQHQAKMQPQKEPQPAKSQPAVQTQIQSQSQPAMQSHSQGQSLPQTHPKIIIKFDPKKYPESWIQPQSQPQVEPKPTPRIPSSAQLQLQLQTPASAPPHSQPQSPSKPSPKDQIQACDQPQPQLEKVPQSCPQSPTKFGTKAEETRPLPQTNATSVSLTVSQKPPCKKEAQGRNVNLPDRAENQCPVIHSSKLESAVLDVEPEKKEMHPVARGAPVPDSVPYNGITKAKEPGILRGPRSKQGFIKRTPQNKKWAYIGASDKETEQFNKESIRGVKRKRVQVAHEVGGETVYLGVPVIKLNRLCGRDLRKFRDIENLGISIESARTVRKELNRFQKNKRRRQLKKLRKLGLCPMPKRRKLPSEDFAKRQDLESDEIIHTKKVRESISDDILHEYPKSVKKRKTNELSNVGSAVTSPPNGTIKEAPESKALSQPEGRKERKGGAGRTPRAKAAKEASPPRALPSSSLPSSVPSSPLVLPTSFSPLPPPPSLSPAAGAVLSPSAAPDKQKEAGKASPKKASPAASPSKPAGGLWTSSGLWAGPEKRPADAAPPAAKPRKMTVPSILKRSGKLWKAVSQTSPSPAAPSEPADGGAGQGARHQVFVAHMSGPPGPGAAPPSSAPLAGSLEPPAGAARTSVISGGAAAAPLSQLLRVSVNKTWVPPPSQAKGAADEALAAVPAAVTPGTILHQRQLHRSFLQPAAPPFAPAPPASTNAAAPSAGAPAPASGEAPDAAKAKHTMVLIPASFGLPSSSSAAGDAEEGPKGAEPLKYYLVFAPTSSGQGAASSAASGRGALQPPAEAATSIMSPQPVSSSSYLASLLKAGVPLVPVSSSASLTQVSPSRSYPLVSSVLAPKPPARGPPLPPSSARSPALAPSALSSAVGEARAALDGFLPSSSASGHPAENADGGAAGGVAGGGPPAGGGGAAATTRPELESPRVSAIISTVLGESSAVCSLLKAVSDGQDEGRPAPKCKKAARRKASLLLEATQKEEEEVPRPGPLSIKLKKRKKKAAPAASPADSAFGSLAVPCSSMAGFRVLAQTAAVSEGSLQAKSVVEGPKAIVITPEEKAQLARVFPQLVEVKEGPITLENALGELISIQVPVGEGAAKPGEGGSQKPKKRRRRKKLTEAMRVELTKKAMSTKAEIRLKRICHTDITGLFLKTNRINRRCGKILRQVIRNGDIKRYLMLRAKGLRCKPLPLKAATDPRRTPKVGPAGSKSDAVQRMLLAARTGTEEDLWPVIGSPEETTSSEVPKPQKRKTGIQPPRIPSKETRVAAVMNEILREGENPSLTLGKSLFVQNDRLSQGQRTFASLIGYKLAKKRTKNRALDSLEGSQFLMDPRLFGLKLKPKPSNSLDQDADGSKSASDAPSSTPVTASQTGAPSKQMSAPSQRQLSHPKNKAMPSPPPLLPPPGPNTSAPAPMPRPAAPGPSRSIAPVLHGQSAPGGERVMPPLHPSRAAVHPGAEVSIAPMAQVHNQPPSVIHQRRMYTPPLPPPAHMHNAALLPHSSLQQNSSATRMFSYEQAMRMRESAGQGVPVGYNRYSPAAPESNGWSATRPGSHGSHAPPLMFMGGAALMNSVRDTSMVVRAQRAAPPPLSFMGPSSEPLGRPPLQMNPSQAAIRHMHHASWPIALDSSQQASAARSYGVINHTRHILPEQRQAAISHNLHARAHPEQPPPTLHPRLQGHGIIEQPQPNLSHSIQGLLLNEPRPQALLARLHAQVPSDQQPVNLVSGAQGQGVGDQHPPSLPHATRESVLPKLHALPTSHAAVSNSPATVPADQQQQPVRHQHCHKTYSPEVLAVVEALLLQLIDVGLPSTSGSIVHTATQLLEARGVTNVFCCEQEVDKWFSSFQGRHSDRLPQESKDRIQLMPLPIKQESQQWVEKLQRDMASFQKGPASRIYYMQELNFFLDKHTREIKFHRMFPGKVHCSNEKDTVSVLFTLGADGERGPGIVIFPRMVMPEKLFASLKNTEGGSDWVLGSSMNGWLYSDCIVEFVSDVFVPWLKKKHANFPVALFTNEYISNIRLTKMSECLLTQGVQLIPVPQNMSLLLSPAEWIVVEYFRMHWGKAVSDWSGKNGLKALLEENFAPFIISCISTQAAPAGVRAKFEKCGIFPFNPQAVYRCLRSQKHE
ncbi:nascent polypeptide-associated complex subunit alpha, muscle-specific form-like isoform X2 [Penaeus chinensis]|uniref:nascent polypeptide-associated complex subunit alpha, muscle-specific form-like isoform X2 n=1 Tax=Penaeus chinensis TaxID=139456 RepID=UPI001FB5D132|nr:nascent polypeptide-associated complex subunit alpha, muscle-specific form-like isoform X2 [Penaeus chinensis]